MIDKSPRITARQQRFIEEYAVSGNATQSAIKAGYSKRSARVTGHQLITNPAFQQILTEYGIIAFRVLADIAQNGTVEIARVNAANSLLDRAYGKPKMNDEDRNRIPNITITFNKLEVDNGDSQPSRIITPAGGDSFE